MKKLILISITILLLGSCNKPENKITTKPSPELNNSQLEYAVFNQVLSLLSENIFYENYHDRIYRDLKMKKDIFNDKFLIGRKEIFQKMKEQNIDSSKIIDLSKINFIAVSDSLVSYKGLNAEKLDFNKINRPAETILIKWDDPVIEFIKGRLKGIELSRIKFNDNKTKAMFNIDIYRGKGDLVLYEVRCELINGAWVVKEKIPLMIS